MDGKFLGMSITFPGEFDGMWLFIIDAVSEFRNLWIDKTVARMNFFSNFPKMSNKNFLSYFIFSYYTYL